MKYLLDTCVISELISKNPSKNVISWISSQMEEKLYISVITIGEIQKGISLLKNSAKKKRLEEWLEDDLIIRFANRVVPIDTETMLTWGELVAKSKRKGNPIPVVDSLIAATIIAKKLTLVTRNEKDFKGTNIPIENPF